MELYFNDRFFSSGQTDIMNAEEARIGSVDLESMMTSSLSVYGADDALRYSGKFRFFSNKWEVSDSNGNIVGVLRIRFSFFTKKFEYETDTRGVYSIESPGFSRAYTIHDHSGATVASFDQINNWLQAGAFCLRNQSPLLDDYELIAVVLGVHNIRKRSNAAAGGSAGGGGGGGG
ncbi:hypothetical protein [Paenibacillus daejeonensis]|uniref:hypothetical protein n=1 Tax=Paenibacillus daejeonensis TaxID=135193 RepID=UPI000381468D|nr:hypothetical protein [Paenibacillus daejeonensis]